MMHMTKTNAVRLLEQAGIACRVLTYRYDESDLSGMHAAEQLHLPPETIFKTLVARNDRGQILVFCIPVCRELDLKKAARASGSKKIELVAVRELLSLTGYLRGGCSPVGMKKKYPTFLEESALQFDEIGISAGLRGCQMMVSPTKLGEYAGLCFAPLCSGI